MEHIIKHRFACTLIFFALFAFGIRTCHLGEVALWLDESLTGIVVTSSDWLSLLQSENTPLVYYAIQRIVCQFTLCDEVGLRFLSMISGCAFVVAIMILVRKLTDFRTALLAGLLVLISPIHIYYSQEARVYSLLLLEITGFYLMQWYIIRGDFRARHLALFACLTVVMLHTHYFSILIVGSSVVVFGAGQICKLRKITPWYFLILLIAPLTLLPWLAISMFGENSSFADLSWVQPIWDHEHSFRLFVYSIENFLIGPVTPGNVLSLKQYAHLAMPEFVYPAGVGVLILLALISLGFVFQKSRFHKSEKQTLIELAGQFILPLIGLFVLSNAIRPVYVVGRYDIIAYPAFMLFLLYLIRTITQEEVQYRTANVLLVGAFVLVTLMTQASVAARYFVDWPELRFNTRLYAISDVLDDGSTIVFLGPDAAVSLYYFMLSGYSKEDSRCIRTIGVTVNCFIFPEEFDQAPASTARYNRLKIVSADSYEVEYILNRLQDDQLWLQINRMHATADSLEMDMVSFKLIERLRSLGFAIQAIDTKLQLLKLERKGGAGSAMQPYVPFDFRMRGV